MVEKMRRWVVKATGRMGTRWALALALLALALLVEASRVGAPSEGSKDGLHPHLRNHH